MTPTAALYMEAGYVTIGTIVKARRLNFLQYLLKLLQEDMLSIFFHCQWLDINPFDWTEQVKVDLAEFNLPVDLAVITSKSVFNLEAAGEKESYRL